MTALVLILTTCFAAIPATAQEADHLYRVTLVRAAPGELTRLIEGLKSGRAAYERANESQPYLLRHSQGDQWDLMILEPLGASLTDYYSPTRTADREEAGLAGGPLGGAMVHLVAWREETVFRGPNPSETAERFDGAGLYHIEMFVAVAGRRNGLMEERQMENVYLRATMRPDNLVFERETGGAWDAMTIGFYGSLQHYAEPATLGAEGVERAAKEAGFPSRGEIGAYLRRFIASHHDTLAVPVD